MSPHILIYLLRRDLRLADNPIFDEICKLSQQSQTTFTHVLPVYVFSAQQLEVSGFLAGPNEKSPFPEARSQLGNFWRCGPFRAKFLAESVWDLKNDLDGIGSSLVIRVGMLGQTVKDLLHDFKKQENAGSVGAIWMTAEEGVEEQREVKRAAQAEKVDFRLWSDEKYFIDELVLQSNRWSGLDGGLGSVMTWLDADNVTVETYPLIT
jgi:deoxyribodipyrimidine photo-lyase